MKLSEGSGAKVSSYFMIGLVGIEDNEWFKYHEDITVEESEGKYENVRSHIETLDR